MPENKMEKPDAIKFPTVERLLETVQGTVIESEELLGALPHKLAAARESGDQKKIHLATSGEETLRSLELWVGKMRRVMLNRVLANEMEPDKNKEYEQAVRDARAYHINLKAALEDAKKLYNSLDE